MEIYRQSTRYFPVQTKFQEMHKFFILTSQAAWRAMVSLPNFFNLRCVVRQGCPLSGLLFVLAVELFALAITSDPYHPRYTHRRKRNKNYAICRRYDSGSVQDLVSVENLFKTLQKFTKYSGLEINTKKTEALWLGSWSSQEEQPFDFKW